MPRFDSAIICIACSTNGLQMLPHRAEQGQTGERNDSPFFIRREVPLCNGIHENNYFAVQKVALMGSERRKHTKHKRMIMFFLINNKSARDMIFLMFWTNSYFSAELFVCSRGLWVSLGAISNNCKNNVFVRIRRSRRGRDPVACHFFNYYLLLL